MSWRREAPTDHVRKVLYLGATVLLLATSSLGQVTESKEMVRRARNAYYSLQDVGIVEFGCDLKPDWDAAFKTLKLDRAGREQLLPILKSTRFRVLIGPAGSSLLSREADSAPPNEEIADRARKSLAGFEQMI